MNRFIGPTGYYFGTKPDRRLRKEKLIRQLRQRFPHLSVFPHPAYWEPWLSPKHGPARYQQSPYFSPGLAFPYVTLRGEAAHRASHVRHPLGVFQLRPWRFQSPLFNLPVNRRIRQGRYHNVFYKKSASDGDVGRKPPKLFSSLPSNKIADAIAHRQDERNNRLKSHLWSKALPASKNKERLAAQSRKDLEKIEAAKREKSSWKGNSPSLNDVNSEDGGSEHRNGPNTIRSSRSSKLSGKASKTKPPKSSPLARSTPGSQLKKTRKSLPQTDSRSEWDNSPMRDESEKESSAATNSRKEREALEAIARRKKYEKQQLKQALCAEQDKRKAEEDYLKRLMAKAMKKPEAPQSGVILHRTRSQKRRALYRKYRNRQTLLPDEQMQLKKDREKLKDKSAQMKFSHKGKRLYPYGNFPPRFQKTPAAGSRFYWGPDGPDLRNESNKDKPNVFRRPSEQLLSSAREDGVASTVFESEHSSDTPGKRAERVKNKQLAGKGQPISKAFLNVRGGKEPPKIGHMAESHSSSPTRNTKRENGAPVAFSIARSKYGSSMADRQKETSSEPTNASHSDLTSVTAENPRYKQRKKQKIRCAPKDLPKDSSLADHEKENMTAEVFETFIEAREKLMSLREKAWQQSLRRAERKKAERIDRMKADMAERETRLQKVIHPEIEKIDMKRTSHLSIPSLPAKHPDKDKDSSRGKASHSTLSGPKEKEPPKDLKAETIKEEASKETGGDFFFPKAKNRREAFRAYVAKNLLRLKAHLIFGHRLSYKARTDAKLDRWGRPVRTEIPVFDNKNPYLVGVIKTLMRSKIGFRYKWESRAEEFMNNFPFVEFQTYKKYPVTRMTKHDRIKHYMRLKKLYRGQTLFKMATPLRWYKSVKKNSLEAPFDFELHSDAVEKFQRLTQLQNKQDKSEEPGEMFHQFGLYDIVCSHLKVAPFRTFQQQLEQVVAGSLTTIDVSKQNLTDEQVRPIAMCVMLSELVNSLDISGNLISPTGANYIAGICGHTGNLTELNASDQNFGPSAVEILFQCLKRPYCKMQKLYLNNCGIGSECAQLIAGIIMQNRSLIVLEIASNNLANVGHNDMFGLAIAENPLLKELNMAHNGFGEKASFLIFTGAKANSSLEVFRFDNNHVGEEGCKAIAGMIEGSDRLHELYLEHCAINDIGAKKIGSGIEKSTAGTLEKLVLRNNPMGGDGANFILKAAAAKDKLTHVDLSLCPVHTKFVDAARKMMTERVEMFIDHTGDGLMKASLPKYEIDMEALAEKKAKAEAAKKKNKK